MAGFERLLLPRGDGDRLQAEAFERAIKSLPLDGCGTERNMISGGIDFVAPVGMAFVITGENLRASRYKPHREGVWPERANADAPLEDDPHTFNHIRAGDAYEIGEHFATRLSLMADGYLQYGRPPRNSDPWTTLPPQASSDDEIEVVLLDPPQAWTETGGMPYVWAENQEPLSRRQHDIVPLPQNVIGMRQTYVHGRMQDVTVTLVEIDRSKLMPLDGRIRTADGRALQIAYAGAPGSENRQVHIVQGYDRSAADEDAMNMQQGLYRSDFADLGPEERQRRLWNDRRTVLGRADNARDPYADDPLRQFTFVLADQTTGEAMSPEEALAMVAIEVEFSSMLPGELDRYLKESSRSGHSFDHLAEGYIETVPLQGSLTAAVAQYCGPNWRSQTGQASGSALFGQYDMPHVAERVMTALSSMTLDEAVREFASSTWRADDAANRRTPRAPRVVDYDDY
jgi:hypothetical protein